MKTVFLYDDCFLAHKTCKGHPESPQRLISTFKHIKASPIFNNLKLLKSQEADLEWILKIHNSEYVNRAKESCSSGMYILDCPDVQISEESYEVALKTIGGILALGDEVVSGNAKNAFGLIRPPGHHAERDEAMGFCMFNNIAILAKYLQFKYGLEKILILDWDVHHGNGTQHIFEEDPSIFYISLHQYPFYPGTGSASEIGIGKGSGMTLNCPMSSGSDDNDYKDAFHLKIIPAVTRFRPQIVLISAGFDAHKEDRIAEINLSTECFGWMTERVKEIAGEFSAGKLISLLEGGYNLNVLPFCVEKHLEILSCRSNV